MLPESSQCRDTTLYPSFSVRFQEPCRATTAANRWVSGCSGCSRKSMPSGAVWARKENAGGSDAAARTSWPSPRSGSSTRFPLAHRPAVVAAPEHPIELARREVVAQEVATVVGCVEGTGHRVPGEVRRVPQAAGELLLAAAVGPEAQHLAAPRLLLEAHVASSSRWWRTSSRPGRSERCAASGCRRWGGRSPAAHSFRWWCPSPRRSGCARSSSPRPRRASRRRHRCRWAGRGR